MNPEADVVPASIPMVAFSFRAEQMRSLEYLMSVPISLPRFWAAVVPRVPRGTEAASKSVKAAVSFVGVGGSRILSAKMNWPTLTSTSAIVAAFLFSAGVGVFFGFYPARKASGLDPIEALRFE